MNLLSVNRRVSRPPNLRVTVPLSFNKDHPEERTGHYGGRVVIQEGTGKETQGRHSLSRDAEKERVFLTSR